MKQILFVYWYSLMHIALWCWAYFQVSWQLLYLWLNNFPVSAATLHKCHSSSCLCPTPKSVKVTWSTFHFRAVKIILVSAFLLLHFLWQIYNLLNEIHNCKIVLHPIMLKVGASLLGKYLWWNKEKYLVMKLKTIWDDDEWGDWWGDMSWSPTDWLSHNVIWLSNCINLWWIQFCTGSGQQEHWYTLGCFIHFKT